MENGFANILFGKRRKGARYGEAFPPFDLGSCHIKHSSVASIAMFLEKAPSIRFALDARLESTPYLGTVRLVGN